MKIIAIAALLALSACDQHGAVMRELEQKERAATAEAGERAEASARYIAEQRARTGVESTPSGLAYEFVTRSPRQDLPLTPDGATVLVHYEGRLADGTVFDSSFERGQPAEFPLNQVIPGFSEAIRLMRPGDELIAYIPPEIGYGARAQGEDIPANSALRFRIQLVAFAGADGVIVPPPPRAPG